MDVIGEIKELFESIPFVYVNIRREPETIDDSSVIKDALWMCARCPLSVRLPPVAMKKVILNEW